jgi:hypothetical protein
MDADDQQSAEACSDLNMQAWVTALESAIMLITGHSFHVVRLPGTQTFITTFGQGSEDSPAFVIAPEMTLPPRLDYERVALGFSVWNRDIRHHLFYFRRLIDNNLPLDIRWLNGYRLLEWHFVRDRTGLADSARWRAFVARFNHLLLPCVRSGQSAVGLIEEARALAAHAGLDDRTEAERRRNPRNAMEKTFRAIERMVMTVLNEHPAAIPLSLRRLMIAIRTRKADRRNSKPMADSSRGYQSLARERGADRALVWGVVVVVTIHCDEVGIAITVEVGNAQTVGMRLAAVLHHNRGGRCSLKVPPAIPK